MLEIIFLLALMVKVAGFLKYLSWWWIFGPMIAVYGGVVIFLVWRWRQNMKMINQRKAEIIKRAVEVEQRRKRR